MNLFLTRVVLDTGFLFVSRKLAAGQSYNQSRRCLMKSKAIIVHCTYSDTDQTLADLIIESFRLFLQKELFALAIRQPM